MGTTACNDYLDVDAPSKYESDYVFGSTTEISTALNGVYAQLLSSSTYGDAYWTTFCFNSDVDMSTNSSDVSGDTNYRRFDCTSQGSGINSAWNAAYKGVEYANNFIYQLENSELYKAGDEDLYQMMGEAKAIRAMFYHDLVVLFGDIPFSLTPVTGNGAYNNETMLFPVTDREEVHKALIADLEAIAPKMKFAADLDSKIERCSKEFCWAMIARMALTCGGYSLHPDKNNPSNYGTMERPSDYKNYYEIAKNYCDSVISSGTHALNLSYRQVFINECNYKVVSNDDPIFEIPFAKNASGNIGYSQGPTSNLYEGNTSGTNIWGGAGGGARLNALYRFLFDEGDARRDYVNGLWYYLYDGTPSIRNDRTVHNNKWSKLWSETSLGTNSTNNTGINFPYMRYADVLLMYAESVNELENGVGGANGAKAVDALRQVRARAFRDSGIDQGEYISNASVSKEAFLKAVLDERKFEFAGESMRWRDLVRNNMYNTEVYYTFMRYYGVAFNAGSSYNMEEISLHDGKDEEFWENIPYRVYYREAANPMNTNIYPNTGMKIFEFYQDCLYNNKVTQPADSEKYTAADLFSWWNETDGQPDDYMLYSFYGFIRGNSRGTIDVIRNGVAETPDVNNLPPVRYILPYPNAAIQRSAGVYKNYYGYIN
jgi:hypothetical protein